MSKENANVLLKAHKKKLDLNFKYTLYTKAFKILKEKV